MLNTMVKTTNQSQGVFWPNTRRTLSNIVSSTELYAACLQWGHVVLVYSSIHALHPNICLQHKDNTTGETHFPWHIKQRKQSFNGPKSLVDEIASSTAVFLCNNTFSSIACFISESVAITCSCCCSNWFSLSFSSWGGALVSKQLSFTAKTFRELDFQNASSKMEKVVIKSF